MKTKEFKIFYSSEKGTYFADENETASNTFVIDYSTKFDDDLAELYELGFENIDAVTEFIKGKNVLGIFGEMSFRGYVGKVVQIGLLTVAYSTAKEV